MWNLQTWAYWTTVVLETLTVLDGIFGLAQGSASVGVVSFVIALIILICMFADPNVRAAFRTV